MSRLAFPDRLVWLAMVGTVMVLVSLAWPAVQVNRAFLTLNRWPSLFAPGDDPATLDRVETQLAARPDMASAARTAAVIRRLNDKPTSLPADDLVNWGLQQQKLAHNEAALFLFEWATEEEPDNGDAWVYLGRVLREQDEPEMAYQAFQTALETGRFSSPRLQATAHYQAGEWLMSHEGNPLAALLHYEAAVALNPADHWARLRLGMASYWGQGDLDRAAAEIENAIAAWTDERYLQWPYFYLGEIYADAGRIEEAINAYEEVLRRDPAETRVAARLADLRSQLEDRTQ